jgi:hypothetical protein
MTQTEGFPILIAWITLAALLATLTAFLIRRQN